MAGMGLFRRAKPIDLLTPDEVAGLTDVVGERPSVVAVGRGKGVVCAALPSDFAVGRRGTWELTGWHEVQHGTWDRENSTLKWQRVDGGSDLVQLEEPFDVPATFLEQVGKSIVFQQRMTMPGELGQVIIAARRALAPGAPLVWLVQPVGHSDLHDPDVERFILEQTAQLREDFE